MGATYRFENTLPGHHKFWSVRLDGFKVHVQWGRIGTYGQSQTKSFASEEAAAQFGEDKINEKLAKGYHAA